MIVRELLTALGVKADTGPVRAFDRAVGMTKATMASAGSVARALTGSLLTLAAGYVGLQAGIGAAKEIVSANVEFENLDARLTQVTGSSKKAEASMAWIQNFAATTPFSIQQVTQAYTDLLKRGVEPTTAGMTALGDVAAANQSSVDLLIQGIRGLVTSGNTEILETATGLDVAVKGNKVTVAMLDGTKKTIDRTFASLVAFYTELGKGGQYAGGMERLSKTLDGRFSNLKDTLWQLSVAVGEGGLNDAIRDVTSMFTGAIGEGEGFAKSVGAWLGDMVRKGVGLIREVLPLLPKVLELVGQLSELGRGIAARVLPLVLSVVERLAPLVLGVLETLWGALWPLVDQIAGAIQQFLPVVLGVVEAILPVVSQLIEMLAGAIGDLLSLILPAISDIVSQLAPFAERLATEILPAMLPVVAAVLAAVLQIVPLLLDNMDVLIGFITDMLPTVLAIVQQMLPVIMQIIDLVLPLLAITMKVMGVQMKGQLAMLVGVLKLGLVPLRAMLAIMSVVLEPLISLAEWLGKTFDKLWKGLEDAVGPVMATVMNEVQPIIDWVQSIIDKLSKYVDMAKHVLGIEDEADGHLKKDSSLYADVERLSGLGASADRVMFAGVSGSGSGGQTVNIGDVVIKNPVSGTPQQLRDAVNGGIADGTKALAARQDSFEEIYARGMRKYEMQTTTPGDDR